MNSHVYVLVWVLSWIFAASINGTICISLFFSCEMEYVCLFPGRLTLQHCRLFTLQDDERFWEEQLRIHLYQTSGQLRLLRIRWIL